MAGSNKPRVVLLGGGNGTSVMLRALRGLLLDGSLASLHALVHMSDDGGSTGRLREQYGVAAVGDLTKCLMALSQFHGDVRGEEFLRALGFRFRSGDFEGHTLRNVFLTALEKTSDLDTAIATMARILQVPKYAGVVPTTLRPLTEQVVIAFDGVENLLGEGEFSISHRVNLQADPRWRPGDVRVRFAEGDVPLNHRAQKVLEKATHIVVAPGHTYGTILPTLALPSLSRAVAGSGAQLAVVVTLLTTPHQTAGWSGEDFVRVYASYLGRAVDVVVANTGTVPVALVDGQEWVRFREDDREYQLISDDVASREGTALVDSDVVPRAQVVHDTETVTRIFRAVLVRERVTVTDRRQQ